MPLAHLKLPVDAEGFLPIRAPPWDPFVEAMLAGNDDCVDDDPGEDLPFPSAGSGQAFDDEAA